MMKMLFPTLLLAMLGAIASPAMAVSPQAADTANSAGTWLERIEARAADIDTLRSRIHYITIQGLLGDEQRRIGVLLYDDADPQAGRPTRFAVRFDRLIVDSMMERRDRSYIFDGVWLGERIEEQGRKMFIRRQLVAPDAGQDAAGQDAQPLNLGDGPFVLPLNLKKDQVLRKYEVSLIEPTEDDPADAVGLELVPRPGVEIEQERIALWFDRQSLLPVRAHTINRDETESIIELRDIEVNPPLEGEAFDTRPPTGRDWQIQINPLPASQPSP